MGIILTEIPATNSNPTIHTNIPAEKQLVRIIGADYHVPDPAATSRFFTNLFELESQDGVLVDKSEMSFAKLHATTSDKNPAQAAEPLIILLIL